MSNYKKMMMSAPPGGWDLAEATNNGTGFYGNYPNDFRDGLARGIYIRSDGLKFYMAGDSTNSIFEYDMTTAWEIRTLSFVRSFNVGGFESIPQGLFFKPDGTKMYVTGSSGDDVNEFNLSTPWNISTAVFLQTRSVSLQDTAPTGVFFKPDGLEMFVSGDAGDDVNQYILSTAWDVSTASFIRTSGNLGDFNLQDVHFKPDGTRMFIIGSSTDTVREFSLSTPWDVSTASFVQSFSVAREETVPTGLFFKPDGTIMYMRGTSSDQNWQYALSTPWDISTATVQVTSNALRVRDTFLTPEGLFISPDGTNAYVTGDAGRVVQYTLNPAWDINSGTLLRNLLFSGVGTPMKVFFKPDGLKMFLIDNATNAYDVNEYNLSVAWDISTTSFVRTFGLFTVVIGPAGLYFKPDGTRMYVTSNLYGQVYGFDLTTPWDIGTASIPTQPGVYRTPGTIDGDPRGIYIRPDGLRLYNVGTGSDQVREYALGTAFDITTAVLVQAFSVQAQETFPSAVFFKPDGTKMFVMGSTGDDVNEYNLNTAWNVTTAVFVQTKSISAQETIPRGLAFSDDGLNMFVTGQAGDDVNQYTLSTAWNVSTASFVRTQSRQNLEANPLDVKFRPDGTRMYLMGDTNYGRIFQFDLSEAWNISDATTTPAGVGYTGGWWLNAIAFSPDGTRMYGSVNAGNFDRFVSFTLSTPWDITTLSYDAPTNFFSSTFSEVPAFNGKGWEDLHFKPDGTRMYIIDSNSNSRKVNQYNLNVAWDISTAYFVSQFDYNLESDGPIGNGLFFRDTDGKKMYVVDSSQRLITEFDL